MKEFYDKIEKKLLRAQEVEPLHDSLHLILFNNLRFKTKPDSVEGFINSSYQTDLENAITFMDEWEEMPLVISVWNADDNFIPDYILSVIKYHYNVNFDVEFWEGIKKIVYKTKINDIPVVIQSIDQKECKWEKVKIDSYKLNCAA